MIQDHTLSLTAMVVQMQKIIMQLSARVECLERKPKLKVAVRRITVRPSGAVEERLSMALICEAVARTHGLEISDIRGKRRDKAASEARKEFCRLSLEAKHSSEAIGGYIRRHHTTVLHHAGRLTRRGSKLSVGNEASLALEQR